jgi:hypothetical protein
MQINRICCNSGSAGECDGSNTHAADHDTDQQFFYSALSEQPHAGPNQTPRVVSDNTSAPSGMPHGHMYNRSHQQRKHCCTSTKTEQRPPRAYSGPTILLVQQKSAKCLQPIEQHAATEQQLNNCNAEAG